MKYLKRARATVETKYGMLQPKVQEEDVKMFDKPEDAPKPQSTIHINGEYEAHLTFLRRLGHTFNLKWDHRNFPKINTTLLYKWAPSFLGVNFTYDHEAPYKTGLLEGMFGVTYKRIAHSYIR